MTTIFSDKIEYKLTPKGTVVLRHPCAWPGCTKQVKSTLWGCYTHWMKLPANLRAEVWRTYQEELGRCAAERPSPAYLKAANKVQDWIKNFLRDMKLKEQGYSSSGAKEL